MVRTECARRFYRIVPASYVTGRRDNKLNSVLSSKEKYFSTNSFLNCENDYQLTDDLFRFFNTLPLCSMRTNGCTNATFHLPSFFSSNYFTSLNLFSDCS